MISLADQLRHDTHVDIVTARAQGPLLDFVPSGVRVVDLGAPRVRRAIPKLARYLARERPDGLLGVLDYANVAAVLARTLSRAQPRTVVSEHGALTHTLEASSRALATTMLPLLRRTYRSADRVVCVSHGAAQDVIDLLGLDPDRVEVIYNPIDVESIVADSLADPVDVNRRPGAAIVVAAGRLTPAKDYPTLLRAFALVRRRRDVQLIILGDGAELDDLRELAAELDVRADVRFAGFVERPHSWIAQADVFALSSVREGFARVIVEALAVGTPVVATDCPYGPREILEDGRYGQLVPVRDVVALADAIERAIDGPPPEVPPTSFARFDPATVAGHYRRLLVGARHVG